MAHKSPTKTETTTDKPDTPSLAYMRQREAVAVCRAVYGGTESMREAGETYLPRFPREEDDAYDDRMHSAVLFNAYRRTVKGLTGMVFRKDPVLAEDVAENIVADAENIDLAGRHFAVFARNLFEAKTNDGHTCILVDWRTADGARSRAEETGARPYWVHVTKAQVIRWRTGSRGGETVLTSFAYVEHDTVQEGEFGERAILRVRQYDLWDSVGVTPLGNRVRYRSWTRDATANNGEWTPEAEPTFLGERMTRIPVVTDYADREGFMESRPPLLDLAYENIRHWQLRSDRDNLLHTSHVPIFTVIGEVEDKVSSLAIGAGVGIVVSNPDATVQYTEASGAALAQSHEELQDIEQRMAALGLAMLQRQTRAAETAEARRLDKSEADSQLAAMARGTGDALEEAIGLHAMWYGIEGGSVSMNMDFAKEVMDPAMASFLAGLVPTKLSIDSLWDALVQGNVLPDGFDAEIERERIESQEGETLDALRKLMRGRQGTDTELPEAA